MVLLFGFVTKTAWITQGCFSYCWTVLAQHQGLFSFSCCPVSDYAGGAWWFRMGRGWNCWS